MASLSNIKPEVHTPEFIVIQRASNGGLLPSALPAKHESRAAANREAVRLAGLNPGARYDVFESTLHASAPAPVKPEVRVVKVAESMRFVDPWRVIYPHTFHFFPT